MLNITVGAKAKINLTLDVMSKRPDGYHELKMIMQTVSLADKITLGSNAEPGHITVKTNLRYLPNDHRNVAYAAAKLFFEETGIINPGLSIDIQKVIPVCAGLAGGSADAASVLTALNELFGANLNADKLMDIGLKLGSDVPYCVLRGCALARGKGEELLPLKNLPACVAVICKPPFPVSTGSVFAKLDCFKIIHRPDTDGMLKAIENSDLRGICVRLYNVFEEIVARDHHEIKAIKNQLIDMGALGACMSGTGPSVFGIFNDENSARPAFEALKKNYADTFLAELE